MGIEQVLLRRTAGGDDGETPQKRIMGVFGCIPILNVTQTVKFETNTWPTTQT